MSTPAQFKVGELVRYTDGNLVQHVANVIEVVQVAPAQYIVKTLDGAQFTCGEGIGEPGAVSAL
jgi:hypothetical protein